jgi:GntR family transcriptional regulator
MEFRENQAIYLQIADLMCENILAGSWKPGDRIPSIREMAESIQVNPNTVMRTYGYMEDQGIVHNQRGIGFFLAEKAYDTTRELMRKTFVSRDLPRIFRTMDLLRLGMDDLGSLYGAHRAAAAAGKEKQS